MNGDRSILVLGVPEIGKKSLNFRHSLAGCIYSATFGFGPEPLKDAIDIITQVLISVFVYHGINYKRAIHAAEGKLVD